jgi:hypothetical protein
MERCCNILLPPFRRIDPYYSERRFVVSLFHLRHMVYKGMLIY